MMNTEERVAKARDLFLSGYNCSQSVLLAFSDDYGINTQLAATLSAPLGGGVGRMREVCGAVTGMAMVVGLEVPAYDPKDKEARMRNYSLVRETGNLFKEKHGSIVCRELLASSGQTSQIASTGNPTQTAKHSCADMVETAVRIICKELNK